MYNYSRVFLLEDHPYRRVAYAFNGKPERTQRPEIMTLNIGLGHMTQRRRRKW
jgi:hypothetical protein